MKCTIAYLQRINIKKLSENEIKNFLLSGNSNISDALSYVKRFSKSNKKINSVLDFGCGVGRLSL